MESRGRESSSSLFFCTFLAALALGLPRAAEAYVYTRADSGVAAQWEGASFSLEVAVNPTNKSGLSDFEVRESIVRSLQRWKSASGGRFHFEAFFGSDPSVYAAKSEYDGLSNIWFLSRGDRKRTLPAGVLGLTEVWFNSQTGQILEADMILNDLETRFTTDPTDTSGYGNGKLSVLEYGESRVFLDNVLTHEFGHALGFAHSAGLQSTMFPIETPDQAHLGCDDQIGMRALYPRNEDYERRGSVVGRILSAAGQPVFGAHVLAISRARGTVLATALSLKDGTFELAALEPGAYFLMVEPYAPGATALPPFYSGIETRVCRGNTRDFSRTFVKLPGTSDGRLASVGVAAGSRTAVGDIPVECGEAPGASVLKLSGATSVSSAPMVARGTLDRGFGLVDRPTYGSERYYRLGSISGDLVVHALSFSMFSPVKADLSLVDAKTGAAVAARVLDPVYSSESGFSNFDVELVASNLPAGDYALVVKAETVGRDYFPGGSLAVDYAPFVLLAGTFGKTSLPLDDELAAGSRCRMNEDFEEYVSPSGDPLRGSGTMSSGLGSCSGAATGGLRQGGGGAFRASHEGPEPAALAGFFLPWLLMAGAAFGPRRFRCMLAGSRLR